MDAVRRRGIRWQRKVHDGIAFCVQTRSVVVVVVMTSVVSPRQLGNASHVDDVGVAETNVGMIVEGGEALAKLHRSVILPNDEDDDEKPHGSEDAPEQVLRGNEITTILGRPMNAVRRPSGAIAVRLWGGDDEEQ